MRIRVFLSFFIVFFLPVCLCAYAADPNTGINPAAGVVKFTVENQYDRIPAGTGAALAIHFEIAKDWHFYADAATAPGEMNLKIEAQSSGDIKFSEAIIPEGIPYKDEFTGTTANILSDKFSVYLPYEIDSKAKTQNAAVDLTIEGAMCSAQQCRMINLPAQAKIEIAPGTAADPKFTIPASIQKQAAVAKYEGMENYPVWAALFMAFVAGIILNIMPCVLPVIPLKILSIFEQAKQSKFRCITLGLAFCVGILIFFAVLAVINIVLRISYNSVFQWGDHFRNPVFIIGMALLMEVLALIMFGVAHVNVPGQMAIASPKKGGYSGSVGMGFLAALLSTPCSFAILTAAFAWAQTQTLFLSTFAIMAIGLGMAAPYAILTSMPSLLKHLPRPGHWMEIFKISMGFLLLVVALWLVTILPGEQQIGVLYYSLILAFCVWMWGGWVSFDSAPAKRWFVRIAAVFIAIGAAGPLILNSGAESSTQQQIVSGEITWRPYNAAEIRQAIQDGRPVLVEFTADWCLTCKAVEKTVFTRKDIQQLIKQKNVLTIRGDATWATNPATMDLKNVYAEPGVPVTILHVPGRQEPVKLPGMLIGGALKDALEKL